MKRRSHHLFIAIALMLCPGLSIFAESPDDFVPGDASINEGNILQRIERELGQKVTPSTRNVPQMEQRTDPQTFSITVKTGGGTTSGKTVLTQKFIEIRNQAGALIRTPVADLKEIVFLKWKLRATADKKYFFPSECKITRNDGSIASGSLQSGDWLRVEVSGSFSNSYFVEPTVGVSELEAKSVPPTIIRSLTFGVSQSDVSHNAGE